MSPHYKSASPLYTGGQKSRGWHDSVSHESFLKYGVTLSTLPLSPLVITLPGLKPAFSKPAGEKKLLSRDNYDNLIASIIAITFRDVPFTVHKR